MIPETVGSRIRRARIASGYKTLRSFAEAIRKAGGPAVKTHEITVGAWEKDKQEPDRDHLRLIARVTHTSVDWILSGEEGPSFGLRLPAPLAAFMSRMAPEASVEDKRYMLMVFEGLPPSKQADDRFLAAVWTAYSGLPELPPTEAIRAAAHTEELLNGED